VDFKGGFSQQNPLDFFGYMPGHLNPAVTSRHACNHTSAHENHDWTSFNQSTNQSVSQPINQ